jgi:glycosyltransferase domain-containing protein
MRLLNQKLDRLTLIVLTYERQDFALRLMRYWSGRKVAVIVLDGSRLPIERSNMTELDSNIQYKHRPVGIYQRLKESLDLIQTEYVLLAGDDEFYIPSTVEICIDHLDRDSELIACCGTAIGFEVYGQNIYGLCQYPELIDSSLIQSVSRVRVEFHMKNYVPSLTYGICRVAPWRVSWENILRVEFPVFAIGELQFEICMSYAGKSKVIPHLMWLRSHGETESIRGTDLCLKNENSIFSFWGSGTENKLKKEFIELLGLTLGKLNSCHAEACKEVVVSAINTYCQSHSKNQMDAMQRKSLKKYLTGLLPISFKLLIHKYIFSRFNLMSRESLFAKANKLTENGIRVDLKEVRNIELIIKNFNIGR